MLSRGFNIKLTNLGITAQFTYITQDLFKCSIICAIIKVCVHFLFKLMPKTVDVDGLVIKTHGLRGTH